MGWGKVTMGKEAATLIIERKGTEGKTGELDRVKWEGHYLFKRSAGVMNSWTLRRDKTPCFIHLKGPADLP